MPSPQGAVPPGSHSTVSPREPLCPGVKQGGPPTAMFPLGHRTGSIRGHVKGRSERRGWPLLS